MKDNLELISKKVDNSKKSWKDELDAKGILEELSTAQQAYAENVDRVKSYDDILNANYVIKTKKGRSKVKPKVIKRLHSYSYPMYAESLLSDYEILNTVPMNSDDVDSAYAHQLLLNYQLNEEMDFTPVVERAAQHFEDYGSYYLKLGWSYKERKKKHLTPKIDPIPEGFPPEKLQDLAQQGMLTPDGTGVYIKEEVTEVVTDHPTIFVRNHNQIILGDTTDGTYDLESCKFIADRFYSTLAALKASGKYDNLDRIYSSTVTYKDNVDSMTDEDFDRTFESMMDVVNPALDDTEEKADPHKPIVVTEFWTRRVLKEGKAPEVVVITLIGDVIIGAEKSPYGEEVGYPFARGVYSYSPEGRLYEGIPDTEELDAEQRIIGAITRGHIDTLSRTANGRLGVAEGFLNPTEEVKFVNSENFKFNPNLQPQMAIWEEKFPELPQSSFAMLQMSEKNMESISGKSMMSQGVNDASLGQTAGGIQAVMSIAGQRQISAIRKFTKGFVDIFKKLSELNKQFITDEKIIALSNGQFETISSDDLQVNVNIRIEVSTPELDDKKANDLAFIAQTFGNDIDPELRKMVIADIVKLKRRPELARAIANMPPPQPPQKDPMEEQIQQLEIQLLQAKIANEQSKAQENQADAVLKQAKASTEEAKTEMINSATDMQDLQFLHLKEGTDMERQLAVDEAAHQRDIEKSRHLHEQRIAEKIVDHGSASIHKQNDHDRDITAHHLKKGGMEHAIDPKHIPGMAMPTESIDSVSDFVHTAKPSTGVPDIRNKKF